MTAAEGGEASDVRRSAVSVASLTDVGPREENQDRSIIHLNADGSWLIAVADGLGGHPRGAEAAETVIDKLPDHIASPDEMTVVFLVAQQRAEMLAPEQARHRFGMIRRCPASTLCVAAWTAAGGLIVGAAGDTLPVLLWRESQTWFGHSLGRLHRSNGMTGTLTRYLGAPTGRREADLITGNDLPQSPYAVAIVSDGIWEPVVSETYVGDAMPPDPIAGAVAGCLTPDDTDADAIAARIMGTAQAAGLDDNATISVAAVAAQDH